LLHGAGTAVGLALVRHPATRAVAFTGSLAGGRALFDAAAARPEPIPVHAEMGSVNPVFLLPGAAAARGPEALAEAVFQSVALGVGQFCTNPGVVVALEGEATTRLLRRLGELADAARPATMLHDGIARAYRQGVAALLALPGVQRAGGGEAQGDARAVPAVLSAPAAVFLAQPALRSEVFGPCTVVVVCPSAGAMAQVAAAFDGQLTATVHAADADLPQCRVLLSILDQRVGRLVFNGFPTGVEVCPSMHHGGPYPATTDARSTSVGTAAVSRFLRPLCYQDAPASVLPVELRDGNPDGIPRLVDGAWTTA
jgi:NADP-dependent aldehyde dehydrogenase